MNDQSRGAMEMTAAMLISGTIGWFVVMSGQPVQAVVFWRCLFGAATLLAVCIGLGLFRKQYLTIRVVALAALGGVAIVLNWLLLFAAYPRASISIATAVYNVQPFMLVGLGALLFGERITANKLTWLAVSFAGMLLIVQAKGGATGHSYLAGIALALGAAFFYAIAAIVAKKLKGVPPHLIALIQVSVGVLMLGFFVDLGHLPTGASTWATLTTLGIVHTGLMYILLYSAIQRLPTAMTGALSFIYPVSAVVVDCVAFGHRLQPAQMAGAALILLGAAGMTLGWRILRRREGSLDGGVAGKTSQGC
ncbi:DMT family transporter [Salmonella enterica subsp. enterica]|nr:EamA/RhaT family transporter [Salmonella enterica subsp. enterica serovar Java]MIL09241.1 DMT family transporter [Salmonella enterica subsp. enterica serovar Enteritidis]